MYPEDSVSARPPSGVQWRLPRRACPSSLTVTGPATRGQREGLVNHAFSGQRAGSGRESERFARPPSGSTGRPRTGAQNMLRPQSAKAVIRERPQSAKTYTVPVPIPKPRSAKSCDSGSRPKSATRPHSASVSRRVRAAPAPDPSPSPSSLAPLSAWRQDPAHLSYQCTGLDDSIPCLVYLPSLAGVEHLPPLPPPNSPRDPLEYSTIILPKQLWNPKKYKSPYTKPVTEENTCNHAAKVRLYDDAGEIIYERYEGARTQGIVRKEIVELERLMQGLSTEGSNCLVVQLQGDINSTNKMVHDTLQQASQLKAALPNDEIANADSSIKEPESWVRFYEDHAEIMSEIRAQHRACVRELAQIEASLGPHHERLFSHALEETVTS